MNLYKISQTEQTGYDTFDSAVVIARDEDDARNISPSMTEEWDRSTWCSSPKKVTVELLGKASPELIANWEDKLQDPVICASFNAG